MKKLLLAFSICIALTLFCKANDLLKTSLTVTNKWIMLWHNDSTADDYKQIVYLEYVTRQTTIGFSETWWMAKAFDDSISAINYADSLGLYFPETQY